MSKRVVITHGDLITADDILENWPVLCEAFEQAYKRWGKDRFDAEFVAAGGVLGRSIAVPAEANFEKLGQKILEEWRRTAVFCRTREAIEDRGNLTDVVVNVITDAKRIEQTKLLDNKLLSHNLVWLTRRAAKKASKHGFSRSCHDAPRG